MVKHVFVSYPIQFIGGDSRRHRFASLVERVGSNL